MPYGGLTKELTQWKKEDEYLKDVHSQVTQDVIKRLHNTWEAFKNRGFGFPRFKNKYRMRSFVFPQLNKNPISDKSIRLPGLKDVK